MYHVGSDRIAVRANGLTPVAPTHAVDRDGDLLCRDERPRYHFPWLDWMDELAPAEARAQACADCAAIALERALPAGAAYDPYPAGDAPAAAVPMVEWMRDAPDLTLWSAGL
jgi:hypothetical protein